MKNELLFQKAQELLEITNPGVIFGVGLSDSEKMAAARILTAYYHILAAGASAKDILDALKEMAEMSGGDLEAQCERVERFEAKVEDLIRSIAKEERTMKWHISYLNSAETENSHRAMVFEARDLNEARHKVEVFCEVEFGYFFRDEVEFRGEMTKEWVSDRQYNVRVNRDGETIPVGTVTLITNDQWRENKRKSLAGDETMEGELLLADIMNSKNKGIPSDKILDRIEEEYDWWVVEQVTRAMNKKR